MQKAIFYIFLFNRNDVDHVYEPAETSGAMIWLATITAIHVRNWQVLNKRFTYN